jgi:PilZ domain
LNTTSFSDDAAIEIEFSKTPSTGYYPTASGSTTCGSDSIGSQRQFEIAVRSQNPTVPPGDPEAWRTSVQTGDSDMQNGAIDLLRLKDIASRRLVLQLLDRTEGKSPGATKRQCQRHQLRSLQDVTLRIISGTQDQEYVALIYDLSSHGIGLVHGAVVHSQTPVTVTLRTHDAERICLTGVIVRCTHVKSRAHLLGVRFDQPIAVDDFVNSLCLKSGSGQDRPPSAASDARAA